MRITAACLSALALSIAALAPFARAEETATQKLLVSVERVWDRAEHSAFTDLLRSGEYLVLAFREGSGHIPGRNGVIRVIRSKDGMNWESSALIDEAHVDLRDPKLSLMPDGRILASTGASYYEGSSRKRIESRSIFLTAAGEATRPPIKVRLPEELVTGSDWLWRVTWHKGVAYGTLAQSGKSGRKVHVVRSTDAVTWKHVSELPVTEANETTLRFTTHDTCVAMIRRDGGDSRGYLASAAPPYQKWDVLPTKRRFGGPNFVALPSDHWLAGSRDYGKTTKTQLWAINPLSGQIKTLLTLPSGGDTSYPGFVIDAENDRVLMSYYSSHEGRTSIYLATLRLSAIEAACDDEE